MPLQRFAICVALALAVLACALALFAFLGFSPLSVLFAVLVIGAVIFQRHVSALSRLALRAYFSRACTGRAWKRAFPSSSANDIRSFLALVAGELSFPAQPLQLLPTDQVIHLYRAIYPVEGLPDGLEIESFARSFSRRYGRDLSSIWRNDLTLGEVYALATTP